MFTNNLFKRLLSISQEIRNGRKKRLLKSPEVIPWKPWSYHYIILTKKKSYILRYILQIFTQNHSILLNYFWFLLFLPQVSSSILKWKQLKRFTVHYLNTSDLTKRKVLQILAFSEKGSDENHESNKLCANPIFLSCSTLCDPMDCSTPGSSIHANLQARILEWVAISFSRDLLVQDASKLNCLLE